MAQVAVGNDSRIYRVDLLSGHNNDRGAFNITGLKQFLVDHQQKMLADAGCMFLAISHYLKVIPITCWSPQRLTRTESGLVKNWEVARDRFIGSPEIQALALLAVYQLTAQKLNSFPLRPSQEQ